MQAMYSPVCVSIGLRVHECVVVCLKWRARAMNVTASKDRDGVGQSGIDTSVGLCVERAGVCRLCVCVCVWTVV